MPGPETTAPLTHVVTRELTYRGTFRFDAEFGPAVDLIDRRVIDVRPLISARFGPDQAADALPLVLDKGRAMKVLLDL